MNYSHLYENLGRLFYSVAAADKEVSAEEIAKLKEEIDGIWLPMENTLDRYGSDAAHKIWMAFETNDEQSTDAVDAYEIFKGFYHDTKAQWSSELKHKVQKTAAAVANAFNRYNKAELQVLSDLHLLLEA